MKRPPYHPDESILSRGVGQRIVWIGLLMGAVSLLVGLFYYRQDPNGPWQTMIFTTLTLAQMGNALALRAHEDSVLRIGPFSNRLMVIAIALTVVLQLALLYTSIGRRFFGVVALSPADLAIGLAASALVFVAVEIEKWLRRRKN